MEDDIDLVREAALKFLTNVPKTENLLVMDFDENIRLSQYSSDDQRLISDRVYDVQAEGWTALYDAVATFLDRVYALDGRKTLVVFSDGVDSRSNLTIGDVLDMVKLSDATIHSIHFAGQSRNSTRTFEEGRFLRQLASETGGSYAFGDSLEGLDELYDKILEELFSQYTIGYVSTNTKRNGKYRKIKVEVSVEDAKVRARRGYTGPASE
jgi:VWFA-related protein